MTTRSSILFLLFRRDLLNKKEKKERERGKEREKDRHDMKGIQSRMPASVSRLHRTAFVMCSFKWSLSQQLTDIIVLIKFYW